MVRLAVALPVLLAATPALANATAAQRSWFTPLRLATPVLLAQADAEQGAGAPEQASEPAAVATQAGPEAAPPQEPAAPPTHGETEPIKVAPGQELPPPDLDFDLLATPEQPAATEPAADEGAVSTRRGMLKVHQGLGIGLMVLQLSTLVVGQLNYRDLFGGGDRSGSFRRAHQALSYTTFGLFVTNELIALLAPTPIEKQSQGVDRVTLHKIAMFTAAAGMITSMVMGIYTAEQAGKVNQRDFAKAHLFIGYGTYLAMALGVSALIF